MDTWDLVCDDRLALADLLEGLTPEQWSARSLCTAWTVKDVAAHVAPTIGGGLGTFLVNVVRCRFDPNRASERMVAASAGALPAEIVADLRTHAGQRKAPPGLGAVSQLVDVLVHTLDVAVPLGLRVERPPEHWRQALTWLTGPKASWGYVPPGRPEATLVAEDVDWTAGSGPEVRGPARALALSLCGRPALLGELSGPGVHAFAAWVRGHAGE